MITIANPHICLLNDLSIWAIRSASLLAELSPDWIKALEDSRTLQQNLQVQHFASLLWMTKLVAAGLLLEVFEIAYDVLQGIAHCRGKETRNHTPLWITLFGAFGWLMIVIGVTGEFVFESKVNTDDAQISSINQKLLGDAESTASEARTRAAGLEVRAAQLEKDSEGLKKAAEDERLERVKLEASVAPRRLAIDEQKRIGAACAALYTYGESKRIRVSSYGLDPEAAGLVAQIGASLGSSNLYVTLSPAEEIVSGGFDTGVAIRSAPEDLKFADCLRTALTDIGHLADVEVNPATHSGAAIGGRAVVGGNAGFGGGGSIIAAAPEPAGFPVDVFVGIKPIPTAITVKVK